MISSHMDLVTARQSSTDVACRCYLPKCSYICLTLVLYVIIQIMPDAAGIMQICWLEVVKCCPRADLQSHYIELLPQLQFKMLICHRILAMLNFFVCLIGIAKLDIC